MNFVEYLIKTKQFKNVYKNYNLSAAARTVLKLLKYRLKFPNKYLREARCKDIIKESLGKLNKILEKEPACVDLQSHDLGDERPIKIITVGDIHFNEYALNYVLEYFYEVREKDPNTHYKLLFLGDYTDRGYQAEKYDTQNTPLNVLVTLFKAKIQHPNDIIMLRGNHETSGANKRYGLSEKLNDNQLFNDVNDTYNKLPICACSSAVFFVHGSIPVLYKLNGANKNKGYKEILEDMKGIKKKGNYS